MEGKKIYLSEICFYLFARHVQVFSDLAFQYIFPNVENVLEIEPASKTRPVVTRVRVPENGRRPVTVAGDLE